jgi:hypothetical protein
MQSVQQAEIVTGEKLCHRAGDFLSAHRGVLVHQLPRRVYAAHLRAAPSVCLFIKRP